MNRTRMKIHLAQAFREVALSLIGLFQVYNVDRDLRVAAAEAMARVFRRHLEQISDDVEQGSKPLLQLADELQRVERQQTRKTR